MEKDDKIRIRLEISKDPITGELNLMTRFDSDAPNFIKDENGFKWCPTQEERNFLNEVFEMILSRK